MYRIAVAFVVFGGLLGLGYAVVKLTDVKIAVFRWIEGEAADPFHTNRRAQKRAKLK